jgi:cytoskeletal protein CcmA (bactofilin family)
MKNSKMRQSMAKEDVDLRNRLEEQRRRSQLIREQAAQRGFEEPAQSIEPRKVSSENNNLMIGEGVTFSGSISVPGTAVINGKVNGELSAETLNIGRTGHITGKVKAKEIDVHGELHEDVTCDMHLVIHASGVVSGKLEYAELEIERGGQFRGQMNQRSKP